MKKRILITGAAKRIGKEMALSFFNKGWDIVIHYNSSKNEAEALADQMNSERNNSAMLIQANLDNASEVEMLVEKILSKNGSIDALINNASTFYPTPIGAFSEENWNALMGSNLKAPLFLIQSFHKELEKNKGFIINVTDINVDKALINHSIYLAAKSGLQTLTKSLAKELAPNIRVNAIAPGAILEPPNTDWTSSLSFESLNQTLKDIENSSGRDRNSPKFSSRTLDIDIVLQLSDDEEILFESDEIAKYRFVSEPLEEIL